MPRSAEVLDLDRYLGRVGLAPRRRAAPTIAALQRAQVTTIAYENLDVQLGREVRLDGDTLAAKLVDRRRGGYCFELNSLFALVLEELGHGVTRLVGRVRMTDTASPRPATHMVLLVDGCIVDVGFGSATPTGPVPLGGAATYGPWTWRTERTRTPEGEDAWAMWFSDLLLYTFTEEPRHPVDLLAPNHFTSTHPGSIFRQVLLVQRWEADDTQVGLVDLDLTVRRAGVADDVMRIDVADLGPVLEDRFALELAEDEVAAVQDRLRPRGGP